MYRGCYNRGGWSAEIPFRSNENQSLLCKRIEVIFVAVVLVTAYCISTPFSSDTTPRRPPCSLPHVHLFNDSRSYQLEAIKWRRLLGEEMCKRGRTGPTGGWCLQKGTLDFHGYGPSALNHVPPDKGLASVVARYMGKDMSEAAWSVVDIGAGVGQYGRYMERHGVHVLWRCFDGAENIESFTSGYVQWIDVTDPVFDSIDGVADWAFSLEVGEHIPPEKTQNFLNLLDRHNRLGIIMSWAVPGQGGHQHINNLKNEDVIHMVTAMGYFQDEWCLKFQEDGRRAHQYSWFKNTFLVFKKQVAPRDNAS